MNSKRKNILLIVTDQERSWKDLPAGFEFDHEMPNRARLLGSGVSFSNAHIASNPCTPSRANLYTGLHFNQTGMSQNFLSLPKDQVAMPTIGHMLRAEGFHTVYKGKWHLGGVPGSEEASPMFQKEGLRAVQQQQIPGAQVATQDALEPYGFSEWCPYGDCVGVAQEGYRQDPMYAREAKNWLLDSGRRLANDNTPWFLAVNFINPHDIMWFIASEMQRKSLDRQREVLKSGEVGVLSPFLNASFMAAPVDELYQKSFGFLPESLRAHIEPVGEAEGLPMPARLFQRQFDVAFGPMVDGGGVGPNTHEINAIWSRYLDYYLNCLRDVDQHIGIVLDALEAANLVQDTVVILTADHGELAGEHGLRQKDGTIYKENISVPLVIRHPDVAAKAEVTTMVSLVDVAPTLLALAGVGDSVRAARYPQLHGRNLLPEVLQGDTGCDTDRGVLFQYGLGAPPKRDKASYRPFCQAILTKQYKFARYFAGAKGYEFP